MFAPLVLTLLLAGDAQAPSVLLQRGLQAMQQGQLADARQDLEHASQLDSNNAYIWAALAEVYLRSQNPDLAASAATQAVDHGRNDPVVCHALAIYYSDAKQFHSAAEFEAQFAASPKADAGAAARAAQWYLVSGDTDRAMAIARKPSLHDPDAAFEYAQLFLRHGDFSAAANLLDTSLRAFPGNPQLMLASGVARYGQRRFEEAISAFLNVIKIDPSLGQPYEFIGRMLDQAGAHLGEIVQLCESWARANPDKAPPQMELAKALYAQDSQNERSEPLLLRSIQLDPANWEAHYQLGVLLEDRRQFAAAAGQLRQATELNPKEPVPHYHLARIYDRLGDPDRAVAERKIHQELTSSSPPDRPR